VSFPIFSLFSAIGHAEVDEIFGFHGRMVGWKLDGRIPAVVFVFMGETGEPAGMCALLRRLKAGCFAV